MAIHEKDQIYRNQLSSLESQFGPNSKEVKDLWLAIHNNDADDLAEIMTIIRERGWVGPNLVGDRASNTLFLVIQHADLQSRQYYLPLMREAVKNNKAKPSSLALLEDRTAFESRGKQIYGSQIVDNGDGVLRVAPIEDPDNVDARRASVGLPPMAEYVMHWKIVWDLEAHKNQQRREPAVAPQ